MPHGHLWRQHESTLRDLYQVKRLSLEQVKQVMESKHGFPSMPLSIYETRLRDELGLRKKLKKSDWPSVYGHYLKHRSSDVAIYFHGTRIPWKKAWKEIRRTGAHLSTQGHDDPLPAGIVFRTPSPTPSSANSQVEKTNVDQTVARPLGLSNPRVMVLPLHGNLRESHGRSFRVPKSHIFPEWQKLSLESLPWNQWIQQTQSLVSTTPESQSLRATATFMGFLNSASSSGSLTSSTPLQTLQLYRQITTSAGQLSPNFDVFHFLAELIYKLSNKSFGGLETTPTGTRGLFLSLSSRIPMSALNALFNSGFPSVQAAWETLIYMRLDESGREEFEYLMQVGLRHRNWVFPHRHRLLAKASYHGCIDVIRRLVALGARPDVPIHRLMDFSSVERSRGWGIMIPTAVIAAAVRGHIDCARLLIDHCHVNQAFLLEGGYRALSDPPFLASNFTVFLDYMFCDNHSSVSALSAVLELFLAAGAGVDTPVPRSLMNRDLFDLHITNGVPQHWQITCLDWCFHQDPEVFKKMVLYSKVPGQQLSRARLLQAATGGSGAIKAYLSTILCGEPDEITRLLELCLAEQLVFTLPFDKPPNVADLFRMRLRIVQAFIEFGVDIRLPSLSLSIQDVLYQVVKVADESSAAIIRHVLLQGARIDAIVLKNAVPVTGSGLGLLPALAQLGADFGSLGGLALAEASVRHNWEAFEWLLSAGIDLNTAVPTPDGVSTVINLVCQGSIWTFSNAFYTGNASAWNKPKNDMVRRLIQAGATLRSSPHDDEPLIFLRDQIISDYFDGDNYRERILMFLDTGFDLRDPLVAKYGLLEACRAAYPLVRETASTMFEILFRRGVPVCPGDLAVLICLGGRYELVEELINAGADVHAYVPARSQKGSGRAPTLGGFSPIQAAATQQDERIVSLLIRHGADINRQAYPERGITALQAACHRSAASEKQRLQRAKFLIDHGADANAPPAMNEGLTALHRAIDIAGLDLVLLLLDHGADPNAPTTSDGPFRTALDLAAEKGALDIVQLLLNQGGRSSQAGRSGLDEAIASAARAGHIALARYLWSHAKTSAQLEGRTTLNFCDGCLMPSCSGCVIPEGNNISTSSKL